MKFLEHELVEDKNMYGGKVIKDLPVLFFINNNKYRAMFKAEVEASHGRGYYYTYYNTGEFNNEIDLLSDLVRNGVKNLDKYFHKYLILL